MCEVCENIAKAIHGGQSEEERLRRLEWEHLERMADKEHTHAERLAKIQAKEEVEEEVAEIILENVALEAENEVLNDVLAPEAAEEAPDVVIVNDNEEEPVEEDTELPPAEEHHDIDESKSRHPSHKEWSMFGL